MALPQEILDQLEALVEEKFNELVNARKLDVTNEATSLSTFIEQAMRRMDGNEPITQGFFRNFIDWLGRYYSYILSQDTDNTLAAIKYIKPVDFAPAPDCGKVIAPFGCLVLTGAGVAPTVPVPAATTPDEVGFDPSTHIINGGLAYNVTDNLWYYRGGDTIYELRQALALGVADILDFDATIQAELAGYVQTEAGKGLSTNDLTNALKAAYDGAVTHAALTDVHLEPDGTTIAKSPTDKLAVVASAILALFSGTAPIVRTAGAFSLAINTDQFEIVDNKLQIKAGVLGGGDPVTLSFNPATNILSIGVGGDASVDLSTLSGGAVDLTNYVKKTGEISQTIEGNLLVTGEVEPFAAP